MTTRGTRASIAPIRFLSRIRSAPLWALLLGGATFVRAIWTPCFLTTDRFHFQDGDALYHLRQIHWGALRFPSLPIHDSYLFYPNGGGSPWPGGFDLILAGIWKLATLMGLGGTLHEEFVANAVVVLLGLFLVVLTVSFARSLWGSEAGWLAGAFAAFMPALVDVSKMGRIDHHVFEPLVLLVGLHPGISPIACGVFLGLSVGISQSTFLPICIVAAASVLSAFLENPLRARAIARATLLTAAPVVMVTAWAHGAWFDDRSVSLFHLGMIASWYFATGVATAASQRDRWVSGVVTASLLIATAMPLFSSARFLGTNPVLNLVAEVTSGWDVAFISDGYLTDNVVLWPVVLAFLAAAVIRKRQPAACFGLLWASLCGMAAAMMQLRFFSLVAAPLAVAAGGLLFTGRKWFAGRLQENLRIPELEAKVVSAVLLGLWVAFSILRGSREDFTGPTCPGMEMRRATYATMEWLRDHTPDPGKHGDPRVKPTYGVMAPWFLGHHVIHVAERPAVATPFIFDLESPGLADSLEFYFRDSPEAAVQRARKLGIRYVVLPFMAAEAHVSLTVLDRDFAFQHELEFKVHGSLMPGSLFRRTMAGRLYFEDHVSDRTGSGFRLLHEERLYGFKAMKIRLFEFVEPDSP